MNNSKVHLMASDSIYEPPLGPDPVVHFVASELSL